MVSTLGVVVVNYRTAALAVECLRSISAELGAVPGTRVVVVDNASGDGSPERISGAIAAQGWGGWASLLALESNRGFSAGNNAGIRLLLREPEPPGWLLLLNPDTLVRPGALRALVDRAAREPRAGFVGSRLEGADGTPQHCAFRFPSILAEFERALRLGPVSRLLARWVVARPPADSAFRADWVSGASMLVRREVLEGVGLLDEGYFLYFEEVDLCLRAARAGWECWHEPASHVVHLVGQATGVDPSVSIRRLPGYVLDSRRRFFVKNHGAAYAALADLAWIAGHLGWRLRMRLQRRPERAAPGVLGDFLGHSVLMRRGSG